MCADNVCPFGFVGDEIVDFGNGAIENRNFEPVVVHVEDKVLSHDGEADEADITRCVWHTVSQGFLILSLRAADAFKFYRSGQTSKKTGLFGPHPGLGGACIRRELKPARGSIHPNFSRALVSRHVEMFQQASRRIVAGWLTVALRIAPEARQG
jgi:hypothetical protein